MLHHRALEPLSALLQSAPTLKSLPPGAAGFHPTPAALIVPATPKRRALDAVFLHDLLGLFAQVAVLRGITGALRENFLQLGLRLGWEIIPSGRATSGPGVDGRPQQPCLNRRDDGSIFTTQHLGGLQIELAGFEEVELLLHRGAKFRIFFSGDLGTHVLNRDVLGRNGFGGFNGGLICGMDQWGKNHDPD